MAQVTTGLRAALSSPTIYDIFQRLMGGRAGRVDFAGSLVRASAGARVLDIGCGTGELLAYLPPEIEYVGYDISSKYISAAQARFDARGRFVCGHLEQHDVLDLAPFDIVIASAVLHHLDDDAAAALMRVAQLALRDGGRFVSIDPVVVDGQSRVARFLIDRDRGRNVRTPNAYLDLARSVFEQATGVVRHRTWIPYTHWMMEGTVAPHGQRRA